jgi:hypothetical protein
MTYSFEFRLRAERKSEETIRTYIDTALWFAAEFLIGAKVTDWSVFRAKRV